MGRDELVASAAYQPEPTAVAAARRFVRDTLQEWIVTGPAADGAGLVDDAVLLTSELVTNAVVHAGTPVQVICRLSDGQVEVAVTDADPAGMVPESRKGGAVPAERTSGRGLLLPAALASAWGVAYGRAAKAVWFRLGPCGETDGVGAEGGRPNGGPGGALTDSASLAAALRLAPAARNGSSARSPAAGPGERHWQPRPAGSPGYDEMLVLVVESARAAVAADAAYVLLADEDGELRLRAAVGAIPGSAGDPVPADATAAPPGLAAIRAMAGEAPSVVTVPFVVDGRVAGLLAAAAAASGRFTADDAVQLQRIADRWGPPLEGARLMQMERTRRARLGALTEARDLLARPMDRTQTMALAARAAVPRLAQWCAVLLRQDKVLRTAFARHADDLRSSSLSWLLDRACEAGVADMARPAAPAARTPGAVSLAWRLPLGAGGLDGAPDGARELADDDAWCFPLGRHAAQGLFVIGRRRHERLPREVAELTADLASRVSVALNGKAKAVGRKR